MTHNSIVWITLILKIIFFFANYYTTVLVIFLLDMFVDSASSNQPLSVGVAGGSEPDPF